MSTVTADVTTDLRVDARRARFRDAVGGLAQKARSGDLLRVLLLPSAVLVTAGFAFMLLGWWGAAHTHRQIEQIPYLISGGLVGLGMVLLGGLLLATAVWISSLQRMQEKLVAAIPQPPEPKPRATRAKKAAA